MVAISTDTPRWSPADFSPPTDAHPPVRAMAEPTFPLSVAARALLVVGALVLVVAVAVGTAAFGRMLDSQRGIPAAGSVSATID